MKKYFVFFLVVTFISQFFIYAGDSKKEAMAVIFNNLKAMEDEDVEAVMETVHEDSAAYENTRKVCEYLFKIYDVKYEIQELKVVKETADTIDISFIQITRKVSGPDFRDNKIKGIHTLKKSGNVWKIFSTKMIKREYL